MQLIDTHAHLTFNPLRKQLDDVLERATDAGVERIITVGTRCDDSNNAVELADRYDRIYAAIGIHPHEADKVIDVDCLDVLLRSKSKKIVAIGETGLDYHYDFADRFNQKKLFESHLALAEKYRLPVIIHCREAFDDVIEIVKYAGDNLTGVFHCFNGSEQEAKTVIDMGWNVSVTGVVTFKNASSLREVIKAIGIDKLLVETDCPYMSPEPVRKNRINEPGNIKYIVEFLSSLLNLPMQKVSERLYNNTLRLFSKLRKDNL